MFGHFGSNKSIGFTFHAVLLELTGNILLCHDGQFTFHLWRKGTKKDISVEHLHSMEQPEEYGGKHK